MSPLPFDVHFAFPRSGQDLWANSAVLRDSSAYFDDLLSSGFAESQTEQVSYSGRLCGAQDADAAVDWSDSDDDLGDGERAKAQQQIYTIEITNFSFKTYQAVWIWILTKYITFDTLRSSSTVQPSTISSIRVADGPPPRRAATSPRVPRSSPPVSPKSVYRLAHLLDLTKLKQQALSVFTTSLTVDNVAVELFSSTADLHREIRTAAAQFAVEHWTEVSKTAKMKEMLQKIEGRELDYGGVISVALAEAALAKLGRT